MIEVNQLTKKYGDNIAINNLEFTVDKGQVVGFLGANGAGKTTAMRILSGYMPATSGEANVAGFDVFDESLSVRESVGYLPENVPLYLEMRVFEFLLFRSRLKGFSKDRAKKQVFEVMEKCWISDVKDKMIGKLSKGYRQRVGLADALLNNPQLLILDEPTVGLDPKQIIKVRELITELGKSHTIFLSSHILPEVEAVCDKILIIDKGQVVAEDSPEDLRAKVLGGQKFELELKAKNKTDIKNCLSSLEGINDLSIEKLDKEYFKVVINTENSEDIRENIFNVCMKKKLAIRELKKSSASLEDVFLKITTSEKVDEINEKEGDVDV